MERKRKRREEKRKRERRGGVERMEEERKVERRKGKKKEEVGGASPKPGIRSAEGSRLHSTVSEVTAPSHMDSAHTSAIHTCYSVKLNTL